MIIKPIYYKAIKIVMIHKKAFVICLFFAYIATSQLAYAQIAGEWKTIDDNTGKARSIIKIYEANNGKYYAKIQKLLDSDRNQDAVCEKCPGEKKGQKLVGMVILRDMTKSGETLSNGHILDPESGKEYTCKIWLEGKELKVRGYWGVFYRTQTWYKNN